MIVADRKSLAKSVLHDVRQAKAERAGFEPAVRFDPHTAFPVPHLRPLGHLSGPGNASSLSLWFAPDKRYNALMLICLFDIDGTLLASGGAGKAALESAFTAEFQIALRHQIPYSGRTDRAIMRD